MRAYLGLNSYNPMQKETSTSHFIDEAMEAQRSKVTYLKTTARKGGGWGSNPGLSDCKADSIYYSLLLR